MGYAGLDAPVQILHNIAKMTALSLLLSSGDAFINVTMSMSHFVKTWNKKTYINKLHSKP
uniref:Uncharacterized protein n=1 Tax=Anguilla anguilla TaxID=7936 RepID=A0A0E9X9D4_ANGAN